MSRALRWINALLLTALAGCATTGPEPGTGGERPSWPSAIESVGDRTVFEVDERASELRVLVAPAGSLARLGHHHVVGGPVISGRILLAEDAGSTAADLVVDVPALAVDRSSWRDAEGLDPIDPDAIEGTRKNLLGSEVLDAEAHPRIELRSVSAVGPSWQPDVTFRIRLRGLVSEATVPVAVVRDENRLTAIGAFEIDQTALGMTPFSAAGGALRVADRMTIRFRIVARAADAGRPGVRAD